MFRAQIAMTWKGQVKHKKDKKTCPFWHPRWLQKSSIMGLLLDSRVCGIPYGIRALLCRHPSVTQTQQHKCVALPCNQPAIHGSVLTKFIQAVVFSSISDATSIFRKNRRWEAFESGHILKQLCWFQLISPGVYSRTVSNNATLRVTAGHTRSS